MAYNTLMDIKQMLNAMEYSFKMQNRVNAEKRSKKAEEEYNEFKEKLRLAAANRIELEGLS